MRLLLSITIVALLFQNLTAFSQELDLGTLKITYNLSYINDSSIMQKVSNDEMILLAGKKISSFYSFKQFMADSLKQADEAKGVAQADMMANLSKYKGSKNSYTIFKNYPAGQMTTFDKIALDRFQYEEKLSSPDWKISNEKVKILNYTCQKATAFYLGRHYEAWFTPDIAVNNGPWKFNGLPGLILRVYDTRKHYSFECTGIETLKPGKPIQLPKGNFIKVSKAEFQKTYRRCMNDPMGYLEATTGIKGPAGNNAPPKPYNPIEL